MSNMFSKLKQVKDLRSQAKTMQNALAGEFTTVEKNGIKLVMNGNLEVTSLTITEDLNKEKLSDTMKDLINDSVKKTQKLMAQKLQEMGGFPGLS